jgi:ribonuclease HI
MEKIIVHSDGGARGNPGPAAIGVVVFDEQYNEVERCGECIGNHTNNVAEYLGLIKALVLAKKYTTNEVRVCMDSELVVKQVVGEYKVKAPHLQPFLAEVKRLEQAFNKVSYTHVARENRYQSRADYLVNFALDSI